MQNVRSPNRRVGFVDSIVLAPLGLLVTNRSQNHSMARADWPKSLKDCSHPLPKMLFWTAKALIFPMGGLMQIPNGFHRAEATKKKEIRARPVCGLSLFRHWRYA